MIGLADREADGFNIADVLPQLQLKKGGRLEASRVEEMIRLRGKSIMVDISEVEEAHRQGYFVGEQDVRSALYQLQQMRLVEMHRGRRGTCITEEGCLWVRRESNQMV